MVSHGPVLKCNTFLITMQFYLFYVDFGIFLAPGTYKGDQWFSIYENRLPVNLPLISKTYMWEPWYLGYVIIKRHNSRNYRTVRYYKNTQTVTLQCNPIYIGSRIFGDDIDGCKTPNLENITPKYTAKMFLYVFSLFFIKHVIRM